MSESLSDILETTEAERLAVDARAMLEAGPWRERSPMASALNCLGEIYLRQGKLAEAEPVFRQSLSAWAKATTKETSYTVGPLRNLAQIHFQRQEYGPARDLLNRAQVLVEEIHGADHPSLAGIFNQQAAIYRVEGNGAKAESLYRHALEIQERILGPGHPDVAETLRNYAAVLEEHGREAEAGDLLARARSIPGWPGARSE